MTGWCLLHAGVVASLVSGVVAGVVVGAVVLGFGGVVSYGLPGATILMRCYWRLGGPVSYKMPGMMGDRCGVLGVSA